METQAKKSIFNISIPDYFFTLFIFVPGFVFWILIFVMDTQMNNRSILESFRALLDSSVYIFFYFWLKAVVVDGARIINKDKVTMPGQVFWTYGAMLFAAWMINDYIYKPLIYGQRSAFEQLLFFKYPYLFWLILEAVTSIITRLFFFPPLDDKRRFEHYLMQDNIRCLVLLVVFVIFDTLMVVV